MAIAMVPKRLLADLRGGAAIECDGLERRQRRDQADQIVALMVADAAIEAALASRLGHNVPQADAMVEQRLQPCLVLEADQIDAEHIAHQMPETILLVRVIA